jgi:hypothetical protein
MATKMIEASTAGKNVTRLYSFVFQKLARLFRGEDDNGETVSHSNYPILLVDCFFLTFRIINRGSICAAS